MQLEVSTDSRNGRRTTAKMLNLAASCILCACAGSGVTAESLSPYWSLHNDLAFYIQEAKAEPGAENSTLVAFLTNASGLDWYAKNAAFVSTQSKKCSSWLVLQTINIEANEFAMRLFCETEGQWSLLVIPQASNKSAAAHQVEVKDLAAVEQAIRAISSNEFLDAGCETVLDSSAQYISAYKSTEIFRQAVYAPAFIPGSCRDSSRARAVLATLELLRKPGSEDN